jgi:ERCC4-type nuclease
MNYKFSDKEINDILKKLVIIVDTREQRNEHIIEFLKLKKHSYISQKLDFGDYSCMIPEGSFKGQQRDIYFDKLRAIERKSSIDELAGNFKEDGARIKKELGHMNKYGIKYEIYVEDEHYFANIRDPEGYRSQYDPKALYGRIKSLEAQYNTKIVPISKTFIGSEIYNTLYYFVRDYLKNGGN